MLPLLLTLAFFQDSQLEHTWKGQYGTAQAPSTLHVIDWNIDRGTRFEEVAKTLENAHPDLCLLQEVDLFDQRSGNRNIADELAKRLQMNYSLVPSFQELSQGAGGKPAFQGQAILTRLEIVEVRIIRFKEQSSWWKPRAFLPNVPLMQRREGGRSALVAELKGPHGSIVVYDVHLESRSNGKVQFAQLAEILEDARKYPATTPIILGGDFNTLYTGKKLLETMQHEGYASVFADRVVRTHKIAGHIDWIFLRGPLHAGDPSVMMSAEGSDHFPVAATIDVTP
jgi:endonuclease/exonuclease/phosphatase family metal-dependent hydrolase